MPGPKNLDARSRSLKFEYRLYSPGYHPNNVLHCVKYICNVCATSAERSFIVFTALACLCCALLFDDIEFNATYRLMSDD